jgi:hypothetical protein
MHVPYPLHTYYIPITYLLHTHSLHTRLIPKCANARSVPTSYLLHTYFVPIAYPAGYGTLATAMVPYPFHTYCIPIMIPISYLWGMHWVCSRYLGAFGYELGTWLEVYFGYTSGMYWVHCEQVWNGYGMGNGAFGNGMGTVK